MCMLSDLLENYRQVPKKIFISEATDSYSKHENDFFNNRQSRPGLIFIKTLNITADYQATLNKTTEYKLG